MQIYHTEPDRCQGFKLMEALLWQPEKGYFLFDEHMERLKRSSDYFGFIFDEIIIRNRLEKETAKLQNHAVKVRLFLDRTGNIMVEIQSLSGIRSDKLKLGFAKDPVVSENHFLLHKTTERSTYEKAKASRPACDDVILWNKKGEVTETCRANIVIENMGKLITPPVECGLLPGTFRQHLLRIGKIKEETIRKSDFVNAERIYTINSVRRWMDVLEVVDQNDRAIWKQNTEI